MVDLVPIVLFINFSFSTSSGKPREDSSHAHIIFQNHKTLTSAKCADELSIGFDCSREKRLQELPNYQSVKGIFHITVMLADVFHPAEGQEEATFGSG